MTISNELWGASRTARLSSALSLTSEELNAIRDDLRRGRTEPGWPYGSATSINPLLVILGASPGNSPQRGDRNFVTREPFDLPTAGKPHSGVFYPDTTGYWDKVKVLAQTLLDPDGSLEDDALALFGTMNLATAASASASASDVQIDDSFARWVLATIRDGLRPRVLVLLGLRGRLKELSKLFADTFEGFDVRHPTTNTLSQSTRLSASSSESGSSRGTMARPYCWSTGLSIQVGHPSATLTGGAQHASSSRRGAPLSSSRLGP